MKTTLGSFKISPHYVESRIALFRAEQSNGKLFCVNLPID